MIRWLRGWWDEFSDRYSDEHGFRDVFDPVPLGKLRWRIAEWYNKRPDRCWSKLAEFGMGWTTTPGGKDTSYCRESAVKTGTCYCGKFVRADLMSQVPNPQDRVSV
jgi:hypothetical protein